MLRWGRLEVEQEGSRGGADSPREVRTSSARAGIVGWFPFSDCAAYHTGISKKKMVSETVLGSGGWSPCGMRMPTWEGLGPSRSGLLSWAAQRYPRSLACSVTVKYGGRT